MGGPSDVIYTRKGQTVCRSADIIDVAKFLIFNYLIHAFTVISSPGETILSSFVAALRALFVPGVGLERAGAVIHKAPIWLRRGPESDEVPRFQRFWIWVKARFGYRPQGDYSEPLAIALAAGALCTIVKHDELKSLGLDESDILIPKWCYVHGRYSLQEQTQPFPRAQWCQINFFQLASTWLDKLVTREIQRHQNEEHLVRVPQRVEITSLPCDPENSTTLEISCNDSILKALVAMCQLLYAAWELYDARGRQMDTFGYAAYSLTTIPYALMSFVNLWATFLAPQYSCLFLILRESQTNSTDEQSDKQGMSVHTHDVSTEDINNRMKGAVGVIDNWPEKTAWDPLIFNRVTVKNFYIYFGTLIHIAAPYIAIGLLTRFDHRQSSLRQRVWIMIWIVSGQVSAVRFVERLLPDWMRKSRMHIVFLVLNFCLGLTSFVAAIGGYIIVIKMILDFGVCVKV